MPFFFCCAACCNKVTGSCLCIPNITLPRPQQICLWVTRVIGTGVIHVQLIIITYAQQRTGERRVVLGD